jgi:hypothetical protein
MKKILFGLLTIVTLNACTTGVTESTINEQDSTQVGIEIDSLAVDTLAVDTVVAE